EPDNMQDLKHYVHFLAKSTRGRLDKEHHLPSPNTLRIKLRQFYNGYERMNNMEIPNAIKRSMAPFIKGELQELYGLPKGKDGVREQKFFTIESYVQMQSFHWSEDFHDYVHEGMRADYTNLLNLHCFTSARLQEVCQAVHEDLQLILAWKDGKPEYRLKFERNFCKRIDVNQ
ncbi:uncharacterized protein TRIVIDRAFT_47098, partial [Trichoderma virens Gv29-8]